MATEQDEQYLRKLVAIAKAKCKEDYDIEIEGEIQIDMDKTLEENKTLILNAIKKEKDLKLKQEEGKPKTQTKTKEQQQRVEKEKAKREKEELKRLKKEEEKVISAWKRQFNPEMIIKSPAYFEMEKYIEMVCEGHSNFCVISSQGGLAKTWSSQAILRKKGVDYMYLNSFTSPLELFRVLYDNRQGGKIVLIDDCEGIWDSRAIVSILKNATELNGKRTISWHSTTSKLGGRANTCQFDGRIILLTNQLPNPEKSPHIEALLNRAFSCRLKFSYREKMDVIKEVSKKKYQNLTPQERREIFQFVERNSNEATQELSIRTLIKCYHFYMFDKKIWKELGLRILKADARKEVVLELMSGEMSVKEQERIYGEKTGHSRADFYRIKRELTPKKVAYPQAEVEGKQREIMDSREKAVATA